MSNYPCTCQDPEDNRFMGTSEGCHAHDIHLEAFPVEDWDDEGEVTYIEDYDATYVRGCGVWRRVGLGDLREIGW